MNLPSDLKRIGFVSTRIAGTDGVSLEIEKWARVLEDRLGMECCYVCGECDRPAERSAVIPEMHFAHPEIDSISKRAFEEERRDRQLTEDISRLSRHIRDEMDKAIHDLEVDAIIAENVLTIPMNVPLGVALVQEIQELGIGTLAHHHDFRWERERFLVNSIDDVLRYAFPPALPQIQHVVINSLAGEEFSRRTGQSCRIIPNVMDFENPPPPPDDYAKQFRKEIGLKDDDFFVLQPTRIVERKGIEHAIELVRRLEMPNAKLVITHALGDEGDTYGQRIAEFSRLLGVELMCVDDRISEHRGETPDGRPRFTIADAFSQCDLVTYPSEYEGFGNAFLEAIYHRKPVVCNRYAIYRTDIEPCGFQVVLFDGFITGETIDHTRRVLEDREYAGKMVAHNYEVAKRFFSFSVLEEELRSIILRPQNVYRVLGRNARARHRRASMG